MSNWKTQTMIVGTLLGALSGLTASYLLTRSAEKKGTTPEVSTTDAFKILLGVIGVVRGIASMGDD